MKEKVYTVMPKTEGGKNGTASSLRHREALDGECTSHALHSSFEEEHRDSDANKITFVLPDIPRVIMGGVKVVLEYANRLMQRGYAVRIVFGCNNGIRSSFAESVAVINQSLLRIVFRP